MAAPEPTAQDIENAAVRDAIAARFEAEYRQVITWADRIMGPGWVSPDTFRFGASGLLTALLADAR